MLRTWIKARAVFLKNVWGRTTDGRADRRTLQSDWVVLLTKLDDAESFEKLGPIGRHGGLSLKQNSRERRVHQIKGKRKN